MELDFLPEHELSLDIPTHKISELWASKFLGKDLLTFFSILDYINEVISGVGPDLTIEP